MLTVSKAVSLALSGAGAAQGLLATLVFDPKELVDSLPCWPGWPLRGCQAGSSAGGLVVVDGANHKQNSWAEKHFAEG